MDGDPRVGQLEEDGDRAEDRLQPVEDDRCADERQRPAIGPIRAATSSDGRN
jgi:hypothetical protein